MPFLFYGFVEPFLLVVIYIGRKYMLFTNIYNDNINYFYSIFNIGGLFLIYYYP